MTNPTLDLFEMLDQPARARASDPGTGHEAARRAKKFAPGQCLKIFAKLEDLREAGAEQLGDALGMDPYAVRKRLADLAHAKLAEATNVKRPTRSNCHERIWRPILRVAVQQLPGAVD